MAHTNVQINIQHVETVLVPTESKDYRSTAQMNKVERVREERINISDENEMVAFQKAVRALGVLAPGEISGP